MEVEVKTKGCQERRSEIDLFIDLFIYSYTYLFIYLFIYLLIYLFNDTLNRFY